MLSLNFSEKFYKKNRQGIELTHPISAAMGQKAQVFQPIQYIYLKGKNSKTI